MPAPAVEAQASEGSSSPVQWPNVPPAISSPWKVSSANTRPTMPARANASDQVPWPGDSARQQKGGERKGDR
jgi:hypothetical protein